MIQKILIMILEKPKCLTLLLTALFIGSTLHAQYLPQILADKTTRKEHYLPDFSYAGYHFSEESIPSEQNATLIRVEDYGAIANDLLDDSENVQKALAAAHATEGKVILQFSTGKYILSEILYITKSHVTIRGAGSGDGGTTLYFPRPLKFFPDPTALTELREYLVTLSKVQKEPQNNLRLPFSQYAWSGGMIWTMVPGERVKPYLNKYNTDPVVLAKLASGKRGSNVLTASTTDRIRVGDVVQIQWFNKEGKKGSFLSSLYDNQQEDLNIGSHHWTNPDQALVSQKVQITSVKGNRITIKDPLLHDINAAGSPIMAEWKHLEEVGIEHFSIEFPTAANIAHHVEDGYNGIYLTRLFNGWVKDVKIKNADSGILTEEISNVTIKDIETSGEKRAHYAVAMGSVHNVLVENLMIKNYVTHPLSFNTMSTKSVYKDCKVFQEPLLDQHSGANHQNLFDNIEVWVTLGEKMEYPLFSGGGAKYWKPSHGAFSTFWNIRVNFSNGHDNDEPVLLYGVKDGPSTRLIGIHGNKKIKVKYAPNPYIADENKSLDDVPSLFKLQLIKRTNK